MTCVVCGEKAPCFLAIKDSEGTGYEHSLCEHHARCLLEQVDRMKVEHTEFHRRAESVGLYNIPTRL